MTLLSLLKCLSSEEHIVIIDDILYLKDKIVYEGTIVTAPKQYFNRKVFQIMPYDDGCMYVMLCEEGVSYDFD